MLELRGIRAGYGRIEVLRGVDLDVREGQIVALLGPNGAGKTTTLSVISGQVPARSGQVLLAGRDVTNADFDALARVGLCTVPEGRGIFPNLSVRENLRMATHVGKAFEEVEEVAYARFPQLGARREQLAGTMSGGEQQMLALSRALATDPPLVLLDELSMGLAPVIVGQLYDVVARMAETGVTVLMVEQFARIALEVADVGAIMADGHIRAVGAPADLEAELQAAYFGA